MRKQESRKPNRMLRMAMVLLYLVVLTTWLTAGLYAKYTTHASSTDDARVAEWDVSATGEENAELRQEVRDLKSTIDTLKVSEKEITNVDLLRRISQLEKIILGKEQ